MKKGKLNVIGFVSLLLVVVSSFLFIQVSGIEKEDSRGSNLSQEEKDDLEILMGQISQSLHDGKYRFILDHAVLHNENIEVIVKLGNEKVDKKTKEEIVLLATDVIQQNDFDAAVFQITITSFYNAEKAGNQFSQRLSYNDLMGEIFQSLNAKGFDVAIHSEVLSDENVEISLVLPDDKFNEKTKIEVQQVATEVIERNNFDTELIQFNITSYITRDEGD